MLEDESEIFLELPVAEAGFDVGQVELHFGVGAAGVCIQMARVVALLFPDDAPQNRMRRVGSGPHHHGVDVEFDRLEHEVDLVESACAHRCLLRLVADQPGLQHSDRIPRFERIDPLVIRRDACGRPGKNDAYQGDGFARRGIGHPPPHPRGLCCRCHGVIKATTSMYFIRTTEPLSCKNHPISTKIGKNRDRSSLCGKFHTFVP